MVLFEAYKVVALDLDGVVWRGGQPIEENVEAIRRLRDLGATLVFLTNNATRQRWFYAEKLTRVLGFKVSEGQVYTSGYVLARKSLELWGPMKMFVIGEEGLAEELVKSGHSVVGLDAVDSCSLDAVVVSLDRHLTYAKLRAAHRAIRYCNAKFLATNPDPALPSGYYDDPGAGAVIAALSTSTGREPDLVAGKPQPYMLDVVLKEWEVEPAEVLVVGDRLDTDVELACRAGADSLLVLTGIVKEPPPRSSKPSPTYVAETLLHALKGRYELYASPRAKR